MGQWDAGWPVGGMWTQAFVALSFVVFALEGLVNALKTGTKRAGPITRFQFASSQRNQRALTLFVAIHFGTLGVLVLRQASYSFWTKVVTVGFAFVACLSCVVVLISSFTKLLMKSSSEEEEEELTPVNEAVGLLLGLGLIVVPAVMSVREFLALAPSALDLKVGGLLAAGAFLIRVGLEEGTGGTTLENLLRIRRELALGGMTVEEATRQTEVEFLGMRVSEVFRDAAQRFLKRVARIERLCRDGTASLKSAGLPVLDGASSLSPEQLARVQSVLKDGQAQLLLVDNELNELSGDLNHFGAKSVRLLDKTKDAPSAFREIFAKLLLSLVQAKRRAESFRKQLAPLAAVVAAHPSGSPSAGVPPQEASPSAPASAKESSEAKASTS